MPWKLKSPPTTPRGAGTEPSTSTPSTKPANEKKGSSKNAEQKDEGREVVLGSKEDGERHGDEQVCEEGEKPKETVTRKKKKPKQPVIDLVKDLGTCIIFYTCVTCVGNGMNHGRNVNSIRNHAFNHASEGDCTLDLAG